MNYRALGMPTPSFKWSFAFDILETFGCAYTHT
jgi:hypothetical protein